MPTCPVCHGHYILAELNCPMHSVTAADTTDTLSGKACYCPRCQTDIYSWRQKEEQGKGAKKITSVLKRSYPFIMPLLALVLWITGAHPHWVGSLLAVVLCVVGFLVLGNKASDFRIAKWARPFMAKPGLALEVIELGAFFIGLAVGLLTLILMKYWVLPPADPSFVAKLVTSLTYSLFFVLITIALTGMMVNAQVRELDRVMPQPIFTNTARLLKIVIESARGQLNLQGGHTVESVERTGDAGLQVVVSLKRKVTTAEKTRETTVLRTRQGGGTETSRKTEDEEKITERDEQGSIASWAVKADKWGRIRSIDVRDWWTFV